MRSWLSTSPAETEEVGEELARELLPAGIILLKGQLGAGKTVLVKGIARGLGIDPREIQSPTFTLMREHRGSKGRLFHLDLYRLDTEEVENLGFEEVLAGEGVKAVEWPDRLPPDFLSGARGLTVDIVLAEERKNREIIAKSLSGHTSKSSN